MQSDPPTLPFVTAENSVAPLQLLPEPVDSLHVTRPFLILAEYDLSRNNRWSHSIRHPKPGCISNNPDTGSAGQPCRERLTKEMV